MDEDERKAVIADLFRYRGLLSGTLDPAKLGGYEHIIRRLEARLLAADFSVPAEMRNQTA